MKKRLFLVDDRELIRDSLARNISSMPDLETCGVGHGKMDALKAIQKACPDLVLINLSAAECGVMNLVTTVTDEGFPVLTYSLGREDHHQGEAAIRAGASGFVSCGSSMDACFEAIRTVLRGSVYLSRELHRGAVDRLRGGARRGEMGSVQSLSARECDVLNLLSQGCSGKEIGVSLGISEKTVYTYMSRIRKKLGIQEPGDLLRSAISISKQRLDVTSQGEYPAVNP